MRNILRKYKKEYAFAVIVGIVIHGFFLTNILKNYDGIIPASGGGGSYGIFGLWGVGLDGGRWMQDIAGRFQYIWSAGYNVPYINTLVSLLLLGVAACILVNQIHPEKGYTKYLCIVLFMAFPVSAVLLVFSAVSFTTATCIVLMLLAVYYTDCGKYGWVLSILLGGAALGIYQAWYPFLISLLLLKLFRVLIRDELTDRQILKKGMIYALVCVGSMVFYYVALKVILFLTGASLSDYQGIDQLNAPVTLLSTAFAKLAGAYRIFLELPIRGHWGIANTRVLRYCLLLCLLISAAWVIFYVIRFIKEKKWARLSMFLLATLLFPIGVTGVYVMSNEGTSIYTLMGYPCLSYYYLPLILGGGRGTLTNTAFSGNTKRQLPERIAGMVNKSPSLVCAIVLAVATTQYAYLDNWNYTSLYFANNQMVNQLQALAVRISSAEGYRDDMEWVFVGYRMTDRNTEDPWQGRGYGLLYGGASASVNVYPASRNMFIEQYLGIRVPYADEETVERFEADERVRHMPCYPADGSVGVLDGYVVIKLEENAFIE